MFSYIPSDAVPHMGARRRRAMVVVVARVDSILDYLFGLLYSLLGIRLVLELLRARPGAGFVRFIDELTDPFYGPFKGIVATTSIGGVPIVWSLVVAILAYVVLQAAIRGALRLAVHG